MGKLRPLHTFVMNLRRFTVTEQVFHPVLPGCFCEGTVTPCGHEAEVGVTHLQARAPQNLSAAALSHESSVEQVLSQRTQRKLILLRPSSQTSSF